MVLKTRCSGAASGPTDRVAHERKLEPRKSYVSKPTTLNKHGPEPPQPRENKARPAFKAGIMKRECGGPGSGEDGRGLFHNLTSHRCPESDSSSSSM